MRGAKAPLQSTTIMSSLQLPSPSFHYPTNLFKTHYPLPSNLPASSSFPCHRVRSLRAVVVANAPTSSPQAVVSTGNEVVRDFYDGINRRDLDSVGSLVAEDCVYEDLVFSTPFVGRKVILEFFGKFMESVGNDFLFSIDDISDGDLAVGVTWHLEWQGKPFPFSKGCSFYRLEFRDGRKQIVYGRDSVEPATKPGDLTLVIIRVVAWVLGRFPQLARFM